MDWDPEAEAALASLVPEPFLPAARTFVEEVAAEKGGEAVTMPLFEEAKKRYFESM